MTAEGKVFIAITCIVGLAAANTGNNLVYLVFGLMLTLMLISGVLSELSLKGLAVERMFPESVYAEIPFLMQIRLHNRKRWLSSYSIHVSENLNHPGNTSHQGHAYFGALDPGHTQTQGLAMVFQQRGLLKLEGLWLTTSFPFGLVQKSRYVACSEEQLVYPRILVPQGYSYRSHTHEQQRLTTRRAGQGQEIAGIREYQRGDTLSSIHWRRSASLGELVVKERPHQDAELRCIQIDPICDDTENIEWFQVFERRISEAAGLVLEGMRQGESVEIVVIGDQRYAAQPPYGPQKLLQMLALLKPVHREPV